MKLLIIIIALISITALVMACIAFSRTFKNKREGYSDKINFFEVPIIINNRDRLTTLRNMINSLQNMGYKNLFIIDNESTYPPLLSYYKNDCPAKIFYEKNLGHTAICKSKCLDTINSQYIIYTDSDLEFGDNYPKDFVEVFVKLYNKHNTKDNRRYLKVGPALRIDDLPDKYPKKKTGSRMGKRILEESYIR